MEPRGPTQYRRSKAPPADGRVGGNLQFPLGLHCSRQLVEQRLSLFQVDGVEAFGEPAIDRREQVARFGVAALVTAEPGEARGGTQFPKLGLTDRGET